MTKKLFFDLETTGVILNQHGIHQIAGMVEINDRIKEKFDFRVKPRDGCVIDPEALKTGGVTEEEILAYPSMKSVYNKLKMLLAKYVNRFDKTDKFHLVGFNNRGFDDKFLRRFFEDNDDPFFGAWFHFDSLDCVTLACEYLLDRRPKMSNFKLKTVAKELGIVVDESKLHDGVYDLEITRSVYRITTGRDIEI